MPSKSWPSARRSHCSRPQGWLRTRLVARSRTASVGSELAAGEDLDAVPVVPGALVADGEPGEAVDLVAPEVDAHGGVGGARVDVDDGAPDGHLAPVLDLVLPPVAGDDQAADEVLGVEGVARADGDRLDVLHVGPEALDEGPDRGHHDGGRVVAAEAPHGPQAPAHGLDGRG